MDKSNQQESIAAEKTKTKLFTKDFLLVSAVNLCIFFGFQMTMIGMPVYVAELGGEGVVVGLSTTIITIAAVLFRPIAGLLLDRFGRKGVLFAGIVFLLSAFLAYSMFPFVAAVLAFRAVQGIGWGLSSTATSTIAADVIPRARFAEGMGYYALTTSFSSAIAPALGIQLIQDAGGNAMIATAATATVLGFVLSIFLNTRKAQEEDVDALVDDAPAKKTGWSIKASDLFDRRALFPAIMMILLNTGFTAINTFIVLHGQERGIDSMALYFLVYAGVTLVTRPIVGMAVDRHGFFWPGILSAVSIALTLAIVAVADSIGMFCFAGIFAGIGIGTSMNVFQTMSVAAVPPERRGVATSTFLVGLDAGVACGGLVAGLLTTSFGYTNMYLIMTVFPLSVVVAFFAYGKKRLAKFNYNE